MGNQNKRQDNGLLVNKTFSLCIKLHICWNTDAVIVNITKIKQLKKFWKQMKYSKWRLNAVILNSLNAHNSPFFNRFWWYLYQNSWFIGLFLIKHTYQRVAVPFKKMENSVLMVLISFVVKNFLSLLQGYQACQAVICMIPWKLGTIIWTAPSATTCWAYQGCTVRTCTGDHLVAARILKCHNFADTPRTLCLSRATPTTWWWAMELTPWVLTVCRWARPKALLYTVAWTLWDTFRIFMQASPCLKFTAYRSFKSGLQ